MIGLNYDIFFFLSNSNTFNDNKFFVHSKMTIKDPLENKGKYMEYKIEINKILKYFKLHDYYMRGNQFEKMMIKEYSKYFY